MNHLLPNSNRMALWMGYQHEFIAANHNSVNLLGYKSFDSMLGQKPADIHCPAAESADVFIEQNNRVLFDQQILTILDVHTYGNDQKLSLITHKSPVYNEAGQVIAVNCQCNEVTSDRLNQLLANILSVDKRLFGIGREVSYLTVGHNSAIQLTPREEECMFFMIRGYTIKQIAGSLELAVTTVTSYIENIKDKLGVSSKSELIDFAIAKNLVPVIPQTLLVNANFSMTLV